MTESYTTICSQTTIIIEFGSRRFATLHAIMTKHIEFRIANLNVMTFVAAYTIINSVEECYMIDFNI
jgi:hypothetical protein